jgi:hypothetical protein
MFDLDSLDDHSLLEIAASRGANLDVRGEDLSSDPANWADRVIISLLSERLSQQLSNVKIASESLPTPSIR